MSNYYDRMIDATVTHGMLIFCDHRKAHELAREADAEIEGLRKLLRKLLRKIRPHMEALSVTDDDPEYKLLVKQIDAAIDAAKGAGDAN